MKLESGELLSSIEQPYTSGNNGVLSSDNIHLARQSPSDYMNSMEIALQKAKDKNMKAGIEMSAVAGIGVDATGSTPLPVKHDLTPLSDIAAFKNNLNAYSWMWKDHCSYKEADKITEVISRIRPVFLDKIGGAYSSEWFWAKILHCRNIDKKVFDAADTWLELSDYIPAVLTGKKDISEVKRNVCAAGHKGLYSNEWGGFPDREFIKELHPDLLKVLKSLPEETFSIEYSSGELSAEWAGKTGMQAGIPVAMGILDAHAGAVGSGIKEGRLVKIIGTSSCDLVLGDLESGNSGIQGVAGVAADSVLPGYYGIEAGQSAVGDILNWYISGLLRNTRTHAELSREAAKLKAGESGLLGLDWNNGNRSILSDPLLSGLIMGQSLQTRDYEIYRALIESIAFGARRIIEDMERQGVLINELVNCGGISQKNELFMQIYADVMNKPMKIAATDETVALGAALTGAYAAYRAIGKDITYRELQDKSCKIQDRIYQPDTGSAGVYDKLYQLYLKLHDSFGIEGTNTGLYSVMKELIEIKNSINDLN